MTGRFLAVMLVAALPATAVAADPPRTGFENSGGASWTTHDQEQAFLAEVAASPRVAVTRVGKTAQQRPVNLVTLGSPAPRTAAGAREQPTILFTCSQHGNEPAGREACLMALRDLAFSADPATLSLLERATVLFVPSANPDGRVANSRTNTTGVDINRDHITLVTPEARAISAVLRDWEPDIGVDLHEYGPAEPVLHDDQILYLWPRNLNVDDEVHDLAEDLGRNHIKTGAQAAGYTADEYGQRSVAEQDLQQTAGDHDEGIARNLFGLRHVLGLLVETRVDADPLRDPLELADAARLNRRRVAAHATVVDIALDYLAQRGGAVAAATAGARERKTREGAAGTTPVYFGGADNVAPTPEQTATAPCGYRLTPAQIVKAGPVLGLLGIQRIGDLVPMAQPAEPVIPLVLDARATRETVTAVPQAAC